MGYLEQFARNKRSKEKSEVLTARLPQSLYSEFKTYCDDLGLSISEAVCLLVEREMTGIDSVGSASNEVATTREYIKNDNVVDMNTGINTETNTSVVDKKKDVFKRNTNVPEKNTKKNRTTTKRFTVKQWEVDNKLPCPICGEWKASGNFKRHAKTHGMTTEQIFKSEEYKEKINSMVAEKS